MILRNGKAGVNTLDRSVFKRITAAGTARSRVTMSADPVTINTSQAGELAVYAAVNALSAEKVMPTSFRPVILLPEGTQEQELRDIVDQMCRVCASLGLAVEGGHTEVTPAVTRPVVIGACTGTDMERDSGSMGSAGEKSRIIMTKWAGMEGSSILARERESELRKVFPETLMMRMRLLGEHLSVMEEARICAREGADHLTDLSEGGVYAALWNLSVKAGSGFRVDLAQIPVLQETIEFANHYDIDPYKMRSMGSLIAVTQDADGLIDKLERSGIPAVGIGELTRDNDKILINDDEIRYLDRPQPDELLKILK